MNNVWDTECSSGCESGWTLYLDHEYSHTKHVDMITNSNDYYYKKKSKSKAKKKVGTGEKNGDDDSEEEDLSMVSDASSGPPHFDDHATTTATTLFKNNSRVVKRQKSRSYNKHHQQQYDDTASSPAFSSPKGSKEVVLDYSQAFSATHFQVVNGQTKDQRRTPNDSTRIDTRTMLSCRGK